MVPRQAYELQKKVGKADEPVLHLCDRSDEYSFVSALNVRLRIERHPRTSNRVVGYSRSDVIFRVRCSYEKVKKYQEDAIVMEHFLARTVVDKPQLTASVS